MRLLTVCSDYMRHYCGAGDDDDDEDDADGGVVDVDVVMGLR
jgi:hypothetical protein